MINSLLNSTCKIMRVVPGSGAGWETYQYTLSDNVGCLFKDKTGYIIKDNKGNEVQISGIFILTESITEADRIVYGDYIYEITSGGIAYKEDLLSGTIEYYSVSVIRRGLYNETPVTITSKVS